LFLTTLLLNAGHNPLAGQEAKAVLGETIVNPLNVAEIKTLDQVRQSGTRLWNAALAIYGNERQALTSSNQTSDSAWYIAERTQDPRTEAMQGIDKVKAELKSGGGCSVVEPKLRAALAAYFLADMQQRVAELDEIKARVAETEAKLQKRLDNQQTAVDLQVKILFQEANGNRQLESTTGRVIHNAISRGTEQPADRRDARNF